MRRGWQSCYGRQQEQSGGRIRGFVSDKVLIPEAEHACLCLEQGQEPGVKKVHHDSWINIYSDDRMKLCGDLRETRRQKEKEFVFSYAMQNCSYISF